MVNSERERIKASSLRSAEGTPGGGETDIRVFPAAGSKVEVIGTFQRFGDGAQPFEVVSDLGETDVRPRLPKSARRARARFGTVEEESAVRKAA